MRCHFCVSTTRRRAYFVYNLCMSRHLYISPHLDDVVFSCGGLIVRQISGGDIVTVLTLFAGDPPGVSLSPFAQELHLRWGVGPRAVAERRKEDLLACGYLGATAVHCDFPEAIYRQNKVRGWVYPSEEAIFCAPDESETGLAAHLVNVIQPALKEAVNLYAPLGLGGHVDHILCRRAVSELNVDVWYYADFPYANRQEAMPPSLARPAGDMLLVDLHPEELDQWVHAIAEYRTQLSTFWKDFSSLRTEIHHYHDQNQGIGIIAPAGKSFQDLLG